jgi:starch-binding outer membrane protein, SusD/RagB family
MKKKLRIIALSMLFLGMALSACKDELDVIDPNRPTLAVANSERGIMELATGAVYMNGFYDLKYYDGVPGRFWTGAVGFHELMGDMIGEEAANDFANQLGCPDLVILDNLSQVTNPQSPPKQKDLIREINTNANQGSNPLFYEWAYMYAMNSALNNVLALVDEIEFTGDATIKTNTIKAWCYYWKGYAYSRIGSIYYAGIINDAVVGSNSDYVTKEAIIAEAEDNFAQAEALLNGLSAGGDYAEALGAILPNIVKIGKGGVLTPAEWVRNINTMRARNILVNTPAATMTSGQWDQILALTANGIGATDLVFTLRPNATADIMSPSSGNIPAKTYGTTPQGGTFKVSERLIQEFKPGDQRLANNFTQAAAWIGNSDRGTIFNTRWALADGGKGLAGVVKMCDRSNTGYELYIAGSYEENLLMRAEANIYKGNIDTGLGFIDQLRTLQGAGLAATAGTGLTLDQAKEELRRERRVGLAFRGFSFYDARRWGVIENGRTGCVVVDKNGVLNTNATIHYRFLDYWDVPDNELVYNPPSAGSAPVQNPNGL